MANLKNLVKVSSTQFNTLKEGGTVSGHTYSADNLYLVEGDNFSNSNLLINSDFQINQRGLTSYTTNSQYTVDRWRFTGSGTVTPGTNYIEVSASTTWNALTQSFENYADLWGQTVTLSCCIKTNNNVRICLSYHDSSASSGHRDIGYALAQSSDDFITVSKTMTIPANTNTDLYVWITNQYASTTFDVKWIKLEISDHATPFTPPDPSTEILKCWRYFQIISESQGALLPGYTTETSLSGTKEFYATIPLSVSMYDGNTSSNNFKLFRNSHFVPTIRGRIVEGGYDDVASSNYAVPTDAEIYYSAVASFNNRMAYLNFSVSGSYTSTNYKNYVEVFDCRYFAIESEM